MSATAIAASSAMDDAGNSKSATTRYTSSESYALSGKIMLSAIIILFTVVILIVCLHIYARWFLTRSRRRHHNHHHSLRRSRRARIIFSTDLSPGAALSQGLDPSILNSLPTYPFSSAAHPEGLECAVCLSEFEEDEKARLLPKCNHSFHIDCIDMWFHSHDTCPLCRVPVTKLDSDDRSGSVVQIVVDSVEPRTNTCEGHQISCAGAPSSSSSSNSGMANGSVGSRRKALGFMGISIEVPRRNESFKGIDEEINGSPGSQGFRTPGGRILSFKRILSREKRGSSTPLSCRSANVTGSTAEIMDVEKGRGEDKEEEELQPHQALTPSRVKA